MSVSPKRYLELLNFKNISRHRLDYKSLETILNNLSIPKGEVVIIVLKFCVNKLFWDVLLTNWIIKMFNNNQKIHRRLLNLINSSVIFPWYYDYEFQLNALNPVIFKEFWKLLHRRSILHNKFWYVDGTECCSLNTILRIH